MTSARDQFTASQENGPLSSNGNKQNQFFQDSGGLNIGFGYDLTKNLDSNTENTLKAAGYGVNLTQSQWDDILNTAAIPATQLTAADVKSLNTELGSTGKITQSQAYTLMDNYYTNIADPGLIKDLEGKAVGLTADQITALQTNYPNAWIGLEDLKYNAPSAISSNKITGLDADLKTAITTGNFGDVAYDIGANPNTDVPVRRDDESLFILGFDPNSSKSTPLSLTSVDLNSVMTYEKDVALGPLQPLASTQAKVIPYLEGQGFYITQTGDTWNSIAAQDQDNVGIGTKLTGAELEQLNSVLPDSNYTVGGLVYVPSGSFIVGSTPVNIASLNIGVGPQAYIYDTATNQVYSMGVDPNATSGQLGNSGSGTIYVLGKDGNLLSDSMTGVKISTDAFGNAYLSTSTELGVTTLMISSEGDKESLSASTTKVTFDAATGTNLSSTNSSDGSTTYSFTDPSGNNVGTFISGSANGVQDLNFDNATVAIKSNAIAEVDGDGNNITLANKDNVALGGDNESIKISGNNSAVTDTVSGGDTIKVTGVNNVVSSTNDSISLAAGSTKNIVSGDANNVTSVSNINFTLDGQNNEVAASNDKINLADNSSGNEITGSGDKLGGGQNVDVSLIGKNDAVTLSDGSINIEGNGKGNSVIGDGNEINVNDGTFFKVNGDDNAINTNKGTITLTAGDTNNVITGDDNIVNAAAKDSVGISGDNNVVNDSNGIVILGANTTGLMINGNGNDVDADINDSFNVTGKNNEFYSNDGLGLVINGPSAGVGSDVFDFAKGDKLENISTDSDGNFTAYISTKSGKGPDESFDFSDNSVGGNFNGYSFSDGIDNTTISVDASGNATFSSAISKTITDNIFISADGSQETFTQGKENFSFADGSLESASSDNGFEQFTVASGSNNYSEQVEWDAADSKAYMDITNSEGQTSSVLIGTINSGDDLKLDGATFTDYNSKNQELESGQIANDGSQTDTQYNVGKGDWTTIASDYDSTGTLLDSIENEKDGTSVATNYDYSGGTWKDQITDFSGLNATGIRTTSLVENYDGTSEIITIGQPGDNFTNKITDYTGQDGTGQISSTTENFTDGSSQVVDFGIDGQDWSTETYNYGTNGALDTSFTNYNDNSSSETAYDNNGDVTTYYSGLNETGSISYSLDDFINGTSSKTIYDTGNDNNWSSITSDYSGADASGTLTGQITDFDAGNSQVETYGQGTNVKNELKDYSGEDGAGALTESITNFTTGDSQVATYTGLASNEAGEISSYSDFDGQGKLRETTTDYTNGTSQAELFDPNPKVSIEYATYTGLDDTGSIKTGNITLDTGQNITLSYSNNGTSFLERSGNGTILYGNGGIIFTNYGLTNNYVAYGVDLNGEIKNAGEPGNAGDLGGGGYDDGSGDYGGGDYGGGDYGGGNYGGLGGYGGDGIFTGDGGDFGGDGGEFAGFAGDKTKITAALSGNDLSAIAQYDINHGNIDGAVATQSAVNQASNVAKSGTTSEVLTGSKWDNQVITWSVAQNFGTEESAVENAFATWAAASGLEFQEVADSAQSDIRIGFGDLDTPESGMVGLTSDKTSNGAMQANNTIMLENPTLDELTGTQQTYDGTEATLEQVLLHEIGHTLGFADNADPNSIMSYYLGSDNRNLDSNDIAAVESLYGATVQAISSFNASGSASTPAQATANPAATPSLLVAPGH